MLLLLLLLLFVCLFLCLSVYFYLNRIVSDIITIQASNELNGTLTIEFIVRTELNMDIPVSMLFKKTSL